jgi:hydrogenase/urease accessory protein HupE
VGKIVENLWSLGLMLLIFFSFTSAIAHPVSQGAMKITLYLNRIEIAATIALEELLVATAKTGKNSQPGAQVIRDHGDYLLAHLSVHADGQAIKGRLLRVPAQSSNRMTYQFTYPLSIAQKLSKLQLRQDVLREFLFAPGNPWEASYLVSIGWQGQEPQKALLFTHREPLIFDAESAAGMNWLKFSGMYVRHGITHILSGYDHLLFIVALALAVSGWRNLFNIIAVFTLAHTITLALAVLGIIRLSSAVVEPMIAASIVVMSVQTIFSSKCSYNKMRCLLAFVFGLFHGLGFAGGLLNVMAGMETKHIALAIVAFSIGVEIGHQMIVLPAFLGLSCLIKAKSAVFHRYDLWIQRMGSVVIALFGLAYFYAALR